MPHHRPAADLRGRRQDLGIALREMAAGLRIGLGRLLSMEDGSASEEDKTFYRTWLSRIEGWPSGARHVELQRAGNDVDSNDPASRAAHRQPGSPWSVQLRSKVEMKSRG